MCRRRLCGAIVGRWRNDETRRKKNPTKTERIVCMRQVLRLAFKCDFFLFFITYYYVLLSNGRLDIDLRSGGGGGGGGVVSELMRTDCSGFGHKAFYEQLRVCWVFCLSLSFRFFRNYRRRLIENEPTDVHIIQK